MSRASAVLRDATTADASALALLWGDLLRRPHSGGLEEEMLLVLDRVAEGDDERIVVAESEGRVVGAVMLRIAPISPLNSDRAVQAVAPHVAPEFRRRGVGKLLMESAVQHAEEQGIGHVAAASMSSSRDAHRFLARMALAPQAILRGAPTHVVRAKVTSRRPAGRPNRPPLGQVLAQRRSLRRERDSA